MFRLCRECKYFNDVKECPYMTFGDSLWYTAFPHMRECIKYKPDQKVIDLKEAEEEVRKILEE